MLLTTENMLTLDNVYRASNILRDIVRKTDIVYAPKLRHGVDVYLKTENLQITGSFKIRGAYYKMSCLSPEDRKRGVIACSAGNHAQGVALAAQKRAIKTVICLPDSAPISKIEATRAYGAEICLVDGVYDDAYRKAISLRDEGGYTFIHPFDDEDVIAGQGTIALEIEDQVTDFDAIVVPVGGGGLISGIAFAMKAINPHVKIYGVQAVGAASMYNSVRDGRIEELASVSTIADGIAVKKPGELTYDICSRFVDEIVTVNDDEISAAILALMEQHKLVTEGAGAASVAAVMFDKLDLMGKKTVCLLSGGNIDVTILSRVINRGLLMSGRTCRLNIELIDKPGQLNKVSRIIADLGGNVISVHHERANEGSDVNGCNLCLLLETRNFKHMEEIKSALLSFGFRLL